MANKKFWLGMLVMMLVFGMAAVGCDTGTGGGGPPTTPANPNEIVTQWIDDPLRRLQGDNIGGATLTFAQAMNAANRQDMINYILYVWDPVTQPFSDMLFRGFAESFFAQRGIVNPTVTQGKSIRYDSTQNVIHIFAKNNGLVRV